MTFPISRPFSEQLVLLCSTVVFACILFYRRLLPSPIPGIPYNKESANRILGDLPDVR